MKTFFKYLYILVLSYNVLGVLAQSTTIPGKVITGNEQWNGTMVLEGDVTVATSGRLVIMPGTRVLFSANSDKARSGRDKTRSELIIKGVLIARGSINNKIWFSSTSSTPRMQDWYGIQISNPNRAAILEYAVVEYAYNGITIKKCNPQISNSQFQYNFNAGLSVELGAIPTIVGNIISENGYAGVICNTGAKPIFTDNMITKNEIGVIVFGSAQPNLGNLEQGSDYNVGRNGLFENREYNIHNHSNRTILAENSSWGSKRLIEIEPTIYDATDDGRYGTVDVQPILGGSIDIQQKIILSQSNVAQQTGTSSPIATGNNGNSSSQPAIDASVNADTAQVVLKPKVDDASRMIVERKIDTESSDTEEATAESTIDYKQIFIDAFLDEPKMILKSIRPFVDDQRRGERMHGKIMVRVVVDRMGNVVSSSILRGLNGYYDNLALDAAQGFKFKAGTINGNSVSFSTSIFFEF